MKRALVGMALLSVLPAAFATNGAVELGSARSLKPVESIVALTRLDDWRAVDRDTLILWRTPAEAYLVELSRPSPDLRFVQTIRVTSTGSKIRANLDAVEVRGMIYPIREIYRLDAEEARHWGRVS
jgi:hypothetical protein